MTEVLEGVQDCCFALGGRWCLLQGDLEEVGKRLPAESMDVILTDPPYSWKKFADEHRKLHDIAVHLLKPDGLLVVFLGNDHLDKRLQVLTQKLEFVWTIKATWKPFVPRKVYHPLKIFVGCRLFGIFAKNIPLAAQRLRRNELAVDFWELEEDGEGLKFLHDIIIGYGERDKSFHEWQQNLMLFIELAKYLTLPTDLVLDPFNGTGTSGIGVLLRGGRYIGIDISERMLQESARRLSAVEKALKEGEVWQTSLLPHSLFNAL